MYCSASSLELRTSTKRVQLTKEWKQKAPVFICTTCIDGAYDRYRMRNANDNLKKKDLPSCRIWILESSVQDEPGEVRDEGREKATSCRMTAGIHRKFDPGYRVLRGTRWRGWLSRKVAGSISDGVIGIFYWHSPSDRPVAMGWSTRPLNKNGYQEYFLRGGVKPAEA